MALAGLWESWRSPAGERVRSFAIITTTPNELCAELHNRMPVVLGHEVWPEWLGEEPAHPPRLKALLSLYPAEEMGAWPVNPRVETSKITTRAWSSQSFSRLSRLNRRDPKRGTILAG